MTPIFKKKKKKDKLSLAEFYEKRNTILIRRNSRGIGDILMHRMIFEDFKKLNPHIKLVFACFADYHDLLKNHPFLDEVVDSKTINKNDYIITYDTTSYSEWYESFARTKNTKSRPEIWAEHCGVRLTNPNMYADFLSEEELTKGIELVKQLSKGKPSVFFCPIAFDALRSLVPEMAKKVVDFLKSKNLFVFSSHNRKSTLLEGLGMPVIYGLKLTEWLSTLKAVNYIVTVDTAAFHYGGGIKKPMTGIFTHIDGKTRGKHYDFVLVQHHKDNGNWPCGPCYNFLMCTHPKCKNPKAMGPRPCLTELSKEMIEEGIDTMLKRWPLQSKQD